MEVEKEFGSSADAAQILGCSPTTVRRLVDEGVLVSWKLPSGHRRIDLEACRQLRARLRGEPVAATA